LPWRDQANPKPPASQSLPASLPKQAWQQAVTIRTQTWQAGQTWRVLWTGAAAAGRPARPREGGGAEEGAHHRLHHHGTGSTEGDDHGGGAAGYRGGGGGGGAAGDACADQHESADAAPGDDRGPQAAAPEGVCVFWWLPRMPCSRGR